MLPMKLRKRANSMWRQKFAFVKNVSIDALEFLSVRDRKKVAGPLVGFLAHVEMIRHSFLMIEEPLRPLPKLLQVLQVVGLERRHGKKRDQAYRGSHADRNGRRVSQVEDVVVEP